MGKILSSITTAAKVVKCAAQAHAPEILVGVGIVGMAGTVALTCRAVFQIAEVLEDHKDLCENGLSDADDAEKADLIKVDKKTTTIKIVKKAAAPAIMFVGSTACILAGFGILRARYAASVAAYSALSEAYDIYRSRIRTKYGEEADDYGLYGVEYEEHEVIDTETGEKTTVKEAIKVDDLGAANPYTRMFDRYDWNMKTGSKYYQEDEVSNTATVYSIRDSVMERYFRCEPLCINDIYKAFGLKPVSDYEHQKIRWWKGHVGDLEFQRGENFIDILHVRNKNDAGYGMEDYHSVWLITPVFGDHDISDDEKDKLEEINYVRS